MKRIYKENNIILECSSMEYTLIEYLLYLAKLETKKEPYYIDEKNKKYFYGVCRVFKDEEIEFIKQQ